MVFSDKQCVVCGNDFTPKSGIQKTCPGECREINKKKKKAEYRKKWRAENPDYDKEWNRKNKHRYAEKQKEKRDANRKELNAKSREYARNNPEKRRETTKKYRDNNRDVLRQKNRVHYAENKDKIAEYQSQYFQDNKERIKQRTDAYRDANKEQFAEYRRQRGSKHRKHRAQILEEQGHRCPFCSADLVLVEFHIDHIHPVAEKESYPGKNVHERENLRALCVPCHVKRHQIGTHPVKLRQTE